MKKLHIGLFLAALMVVMPAYSASKSKAPAKQSAIQQGTKVRAKTEAKGLYKQACYDTYYGCMDQFCILDNEDGGSCACSDKNAEYETRLDKIKDMLTEAERLKTEEVERVQAGANADIIFKGTREYDSKGNIKKSTEQTKEEKRQALMSLWDLEDEEDDELGDEIENVADKKGDALFKAADQLCQDQMEEDDCEKDLPILKQMYSRQITSDCKGFANSIEKKEAAAKTELNSANSAVRAALKESLEESNKYTRGECMVEYKKCMQGADACGPDWENCVFTIASENMQNNKVNKNNAKTKVTTVNTYSITPSTMEILESKRFICERVLNSCVTVRDFVWDDFLRESAPTIKLAESRNESKQRQSCLGTISNCIQKACKDDIAGKGVDTMDACLARPDMARSFCKVEIDPCERMEPQIWSYVKDKLAAMRVDACTEEVKQCITDETRCGKDFSNCLGMDYTYIHDMCPVDKLVVCKQTKPDFSMSDLDSMLMGLYLNIDNSALEVCQNLVDEKMTELCGSTTDCNKFAADDVLGTGSLFSQKVGNVYRVTGMISFGSIKLGDASGKTKDGDTKLKPGEIGVEDYISHVRATFGDVKDADSIIPTIETELRNIAGTINRVTELIEQDQKIQYCITGRNLEQITGKKSDKTQARFPNLMNQYRVMVAMAALRKAQDNYNKKFNELVSKATQDASDDIAEYQCRLMAVTASTSVDTPVDAQATLAPPFSIVYEVGMGLKTNELMSGGKGLRDNADKVSLDTGSGMSKESSTGFAIGQAISAPAQALNPLGFVSVAAGVNDKHKVDLPSGTRETYATFNRQDRICHLCSTTILKNCKNTYKKGFLGMGHKDNTECTESEPIEKCDDIKM